MSLPILEVVTDSSGQRWRVEAVSMNAALNEIAHARVTGSVGGSSYNRTATGDKLIAKVHRVDDNGDDVQPS